MSRHNIFRATFIVALTVLLIGVTRPGSLVARKRSPTLHAVCSGDVFGTLRSLGLRNADILRSVVFLGSTYRLQQKIAQAMKGAPTTIGLVGGSISVGGKVGKGGSPFYSVFVSWWRQTFPESKVEFRNGAIPATNSHFFMYCAEQQVGHDVDLVIVELAVNDASLVCISPVPQDTLLLHILSLPKKPAVLLVNFCRQNCTEDGALIWDRLSQAYDLPTVSVRNAILTDQDPSRWFDADRTHPNSLGHQVGGNLLIHLVQEAICRRGTELPIADPIGSLRHRINHTCLSVQGRYPKLQPSSSDGWNLTTTGSKTYWSGTVVGGKITFAFNTAVRSVPVFLYKLTSAYLSGHAYCWLDNRTKEGVVLSGYRNWTISIGVAERIGIVEALGTHMLTCFLPNQTESLDFRIIAILY